MGSLLSIGSTALTASYTQLQTTSHNIANVNTPGYSKQQAILATSNPLFTGAGFLGRGVDVATIQRSYNGFLLSEVQQSQASLGADTARTSQLKQLESIFPTGASGLGQSLDNYYDSWADVSNAPSDVSARQVLLARANDFAQRVNAAGGRLDTVEQSTNQQITQTISRVNDIAKQIANLNNQIAATTGGLHAANDLLDKRDALVNDLNGLVKTTTVAADDGSLSVFVAGGESLVLGNRASQLTTQPDSFDATKPRLAITSSSGGTRLIDERALSGGSLSGLIAFRDEDLVAARDLLGRMSLSVATAANAQQALGVDRNGAAGQPLFTINGPEVLPRTGNTGTAVLTAQASSTNAMQASDYRLDYDGTNYTVTRLSDGTTTSAASLPTTIDGITLNTSSGTMAAGDKFLIRPTAPASRSMSVALIAPASIAAASPIVAEPATTNSGGATSSVAVLGQNANLTQTVTITFTGAGTFNVNGTGTGNPTGVAFTPGAAIAYNGWSMSLNGTPKAGDVYTVRINPSPGSDNTNALASAAQRDAKLVGGDRTSDAYGTLLGEIGVRSQSSQTAQTISQQLVDDSTGALSSASGVNLDEEAAKMLQYQQSYQAAAKVIQTAQSLFDALLSAVA